MKTAMKGRWSGVVLGVALAVTWMAGSAQGGPPPAASPRTDWFMVSDIRLYSARLGWSGVAGAVRYIVEVGLDENFSAHLAGYEGLDVGLATTHLVEGLMDETSYWIRIIGWREGGFIWAPNVERITTPAATDHDFDADGRADLAVYQPATGDWKFLSPRTLEQWTEKSAWTNLLPVPADYDGDGVADLAAYDPATGRWHVRRSTTGLIATQAFGWSKTLPLPGDYDADLRAEAAIFYPALARWSFLCTTAGGYHARWGWPGVKVIPVPADYDGDGALDLAIYYPANGNWYIHESSTGIARPPQRFGWNTTVPVPGDYDGNGKADVALFNRANANWCLSRSHDGRGEIKQFGSAAMIPVPADYDGDGKTDLAVYHPGTGEWLVRTYPLENVYQLGGAGHVPVLLLPTIHSWFGLP